MNDQLKRISIAGFITWGLLSFWAYTAWMLLRTLSASTRKVWLISGMLASSGIAVIALYALYIVFGYLESGLAVTIYIGLASLLFLAGISLLGLEIFALMKRKEQSSSHDATELNARWEDFDMRLTLFLVVALVLCSTPVFAVWNVVSQGSSIVLWGMYFLSFLAAAILHLWGTRLLVNTVNDHLEYEGGSKSVEYQDQTNTVKPIYEVFISYRRIGGAETARLVQIALERRNFAVFLDVDDLPSGHFDESLLKVIEQTPGFVVILNKDALSIKEHKSDWVRKEVAHALKCTRHIVPITLDEFSFNDLDAELAELSRHNAVSYSHEYFEASMDQLAKQLNHIRG